MIQILGVLQLFLYLLYTAGILLLLGAAVVSFVFFRAVAQDILEYYRQDQIMLKK